MKRYNLSEIYTEIFGGMGFYLYLCGKIFMIWEEMERVRLGNTGRQDHMG